MAVNRRTFILGGAAALGAAASPGALRGTARAVNRLAADPFTLGVASGDPIPGGIVLWTRLAPEPKALDGHGGMPSTDVGLEWQLATDESFGQVIASGTTTASYDWAHSVHVEVSGLKSNFVYFYRFRTSDGSSYISPVGKFRTAPAAAAMVDQLNFATASCQHFEQGWYHAYQHMADQHPDLVLFLGDYMYERGNPANTLRVRDYTLSDNETETLDEYRLQYADHHSDPQLQAAHHAAAWICVFDDHEVNNNWNSANTADIPIDRKARAFRAWYENMPVRRAQRPDGSGGIEIYRRLRWGALARFDMLDTRQFRDVQADANACSIMSDSQRTITGGTQEKWLVDGFNNHSSRWNFLGQQVFFAQRILHNPPASDCDVSTDAWDGYSPERNRVAKAWVDRGLPNPVVLTGDVHKHYAADVDLDGSTVGAEFVATSISSGGPTSAPPLDQLEANPNIKYVSGARGYLRFALTPDQLTGDFMTVGDPLNPTYNAADVTVDASYVVDNGTPGLHAP